MDVFKENRDIWFYIFGTIVLIIVLIWGAANMLGVDFLKLTSRKDNNDNKPKDVDLVLNKPDFNIDTNLDYWAKVKTNKGEFEIDLFEKNAPVNVNNFIYLTNNKYYDDLPFYRMVQDLLVQSGSRKALNDNPDDDADGNPGYTVVDEINWESLRFSDSKKQSLQGDGFKSAGSIQSRPMKKYTLVMANTDKPNTSGSQFFIVTGDDSDPRLNFLEGRHTVIGEVINGRDIIDKIREIDADSSESISRPKDNIKIESLTIFKK